MGWREQLQLEVSGYWVWVILSQEGYKLEKWDSFQERTKTTRTLTGFIKGALTDMKLEDSRFLVHT